MSSTAKLSARERIETLLDDNSFVEIGALVTKRSTDFNLLQSEAPGDGVITGYGVIDNKPVFVYAQDASALGGSIGEMHAKKITALYDKAMKVGAPVIGLIDCAGFRLQEATDALEAFGAIYQKQSLASGVIPQITAVYGNCGGGLSVLTALSDFTFITKEGKLYVNAPNAIDDNYVGKCDTADAAFVANAGLVDFVHEDEEASLNAVRKLVSFLPLNNEDEVSTEMEDDLNRELETFDSNLKDVKPAIIDLADQDDFLEIKADYAADMIIGLIKLNGSPVGVVANNDPVLTTKGCYKAEKFVRFCDAFDIPVVTITNVTGFASSKSEAGSIGIAAAKLSYAFADATVPKINVLAGKAYGSAYITMNSKSLGADLVFALADAEIGPMDADLAAQIVYADEIEAASDKAAARKEKAADYKKKMLASENAAKRGYVDAIIEGSEVRKQLIYALEMLYTKREDRPVRKHGSVL
ncbi:MAG: carboxyl transferase [Lachnospiraceae bacterium]|nr:carboxyl transferase [Lachnospiraceae bacterium]